jgi:hypothetical protein
MIVETWRINPIIFLATSDCCLREMRFRNTCYIFYNCDEPADASLLFLPDAKGMVELAATRLIRESTASRVRDILIACQSEKVDLYYKNAPTKFCYTVKKHGQSEPMSCLAEKSNVSGSENVMY